MKTMWRRELAMKWWNEINIIEREQLWMTQTVVETHGRLAKGATGREIEKIWEFYKKSFVTQK